MNYTFYCPVCKQFLKAAEDLLGKTIECPTCHKQIVVPLAEPSGRTQTGHDLASKRMTETATRHREASSPADSQQAVCHRHGCLSACLTFVAIVGLFIAGWAWIVRLRDIGCVFWPRFCISALGILGISSVAAIFRWKKWGFYSLLGWVTALAAELMCLAAMAGGMSDGMSSACLPRILTVYGMGVAFVGVLFGTLHFRRKGRSGWAQLAGSLRPLGVYLAIAAVIVLLAPGARAARKAVITRTATSFLMTYIKTVSTLDEAATKRFLTDHNSGLADIANNQMLDVFRKQAGSGFHLEKIKITRADVSMGSIDNVHFTFNIIFGGKGVYLSREASVSVANSSGSWKIHCW